MNTETARMLADIPEDKKARGWKFIKSASRMSYTSPPACVAVYARRHEPDVDDKRWAHLTLYGSIRVITDDPEVPTWESARQDAVARMDAIDQSRNKQ
jgi:hypothetical protein